MLEKIELHNFKTFELLELPLSGLNLLSGLNGSGKSSVLQAIGLVRQSFDANFLLAGDLTLNGDLVDIGTGRDVLYQDFRKAEIGISLHHFTSGNAGVARWISPISLDADVLTCSDKPASGDLPLLDMLADGFQFLRADRITPSVTLPKSQHAVRHKRFLGARGEFTAHFLLEFGEEIKTPARLRWSERDETISLIGQVNTWMQEFSPGVRVEALPVPMTDLVRLVYSYKGEGAGYGEPLRPTNVGFGLTHSLPIVTACLAASPGTMLVVENPEAQLHPRGQAAIGRLLALTAASGVQVIAETHSDHVLNGIRVAIKEGELAPDRTKFHFFSRTPGRQATFESPTIDSTGRLSYWPIGFFDQMEHDLSRL